MQYLLTWKYYTSHFSDFNVDISSMNSEISLFAFISAHCCAMIVQTWTIRTFWVLDSTPAFNYPIFEGPTVIDRLWIEFYCTVNTSVTQSNARFEVAFLFNGLPADDVPPVVVSVSDKTVTLHERYLGGKLGQSVCVQVHCENIFCCMAMSLIVLHGLPNHHWFDVGIRIMVDLSWVVTISVAFSNLPLTRNIGSTMQTSLNAPEKWTCVAWNKHEAEIKMTFAFLATKMSYDVTKFHLNFRLLCSGQELSMTETLLAPLEKITLPLDSRTKVFY